MRKPVVVFFFFLFFFFFFFLFFAIGTDQSAHPRSLISTFVIRCLDSIILLVSIFKISSLYLASVAAQTGLSLPWSENSEDRFSRDEAHLI